MNRFLVLFALLLAAAILIGGNWNNAAYENGYGTFGVISDATLASQIDDHMRAQRHETRARAEVEHHWGSDNANDTGLHRQGSARCFTGDTAPTVLTGSATDYDNTTNGTFGAGEGTLDQDDTSASEKVGYGRCWIDEDGPDNTGGTLDDNTLYFYDGSAWVTVTATSVSQDDVLFGENLISNGSFEYGGTGVGGSIGASSTGNPKDWTTTGSPTFAYSAVGASDDEDWGPGLFVAVTDSGSGTDSVDFALTDLRSNGIYKVVARVKDDGVDVCSIDILNEGGTAFTQQDSSGGGGWETLTGTFGASTTALDDVDVELSFGASGQICSWDHIAVYDQGDTSAIRYEPPNLPPSRLVLQNEDTRTSDCDYVAGSYENGDADCDDIVTVVFTPTHPGYKVGYARFGIGQADGPGTLENCEIRFQKNGVDVFTNMEIYQHGNGTIQYRGFLWRTPTFGGYDNIAAPGGNVESPVNSATYTAFESFFYAALAVGTTYTFDIDMRQVTSGIDECTFSTATSNHYLEMEFIRADR